MWAAPAVYALWPPNLIASRPWLWTSEPGPSASDRIGAGFDRCSVVTMGEEAGLYARLANYLDTICQRNAGTLGGIQAVIFPPKSALPKSDTRGAYCRVIKAAKQPISFVIVFVGRRRDVGGGKGFRRDNLPDSTGHQSAASRLPKRHGDILRSLAISSARRRDHP